MKPSRLLKIAPFASLCAAAMVSMALSEAREWKFAGIPKPLEADFVGMEQGAVVLRGPNGKSFEVPLANFSADDQRYIRSLDAGIEQSTSSPSATSGKPITSRRDYKTTTAASLVNQVVALNAPMELHVTGPDDPISGSTFLFTSPEAWLFLEQIQPSIVASRFLKRMKVNGADADMEKNIRVVQHGNGSVIIPHGPDFPAMTVFAREALSGTSKPLNCHIAYDEKLLGDSKGVIDSFVLKRGYMATLAEKENGTGASRNYVAQDHDVVVTKMPEGLDKGVRFVRVFPWRWVEKKGIAGAIWKNLNVGWFYDWNISTNSSFDIEYVPIRQNRWWPGLKQDWKTRGATHLLGFNEPDKADQAKMSVDEAILTWPELMATGLRLGAPAPSDGGLNWLYEFIDKADAAGLRVDFVPVHYYRATADPGDAKGAADQFYRFIKGVHDRVKRPIWITEWNNGANWTKAPDPNSKQQQAAIKAMIEMLDETPFVERYAPFNWVEDCRNLENKDGTLTPAGETFREHRSSLSFSQPKN